MTAQKPFSYAFGGGLLTDRFMWPMSVALAVVAVMALVIAVE